MVALCVTERPALCKGFLDPGNRSLTRVDRFPRALRSTGLKDTCKTEDKMVKVQTQEYDYFGKRVTTVLPKDRQGANVRRTSDTVVFHGKAVEPGENQAMNGSQGSRSEYRVMNPMYRIMKEYSSLSNRVQSKSSKAGIISVLIMDEGGEIRSRLAAAMLIFLLGNLRKEISVCIDVASIGPPTLGEASDVSTAILIKMVKLWMNNDAKALDMVKKAPRQFQEVRDPLEYDLLLVMDRYDLQETLREVSVLDAISPGSHYSSKVKRISPFAAHIEVAGMTRAIPFHQDIPDPLYFSKDVQLPCDLMADLLDEIKMSKCSNEAQSLNKLSRDLAYCCKGVVDMLQVIHGGIPNPSGRAPLLKPQDILQQILRCPGLWMEYPYGRENRSLVHGGTKSRKYWPKPLYTGGTPRSKKRTSSRNTREKGYWKVLKNVEDELHLFMKENNMSTLPTQAMLRKKGKHSLASSIDHHGGLSIFASKMGLKLYKRRPNGFWSNLKVLNHELRQFIRDEEGSHVDSMPTAQELVRAGRSDLVRAIRMHGGFSEVAASVGMKPHRSSKNWEEVRILNLLRVLKRNGIEISRTSIRSADKPGLESAIDRLGGFPYFLELLQEGKEECALILTDNFDDDHIWSSESPKCERLNCPIPYIERVAKLLSTWMSTRKPVGSKDRLPTKQELEDAGRLDIWRSMQRAGGVQKMSEYLHLPYKETRGRKSRGESGENKIRGLLGKWTAYEDFILID